ncbi:MAG TPA: MBL fold metallo-hydrolase [Rhodanobacteraceae bacterium]|nr:MBL fold metallo-hydrolase [Rhodanobacteraceae bacterium]
MRSAGLVFGTVFGLSIAVALRFAHAATVIAPDVELIPGIFIAGAQPDGNTIVFKGTEGLIVFDTGRHPEHAQQVIDFANASKQPVAAIVNSHWHLDHVGGNLRLRQAFPGVRVYASTAIEDAMHGFLANYRAQLEDAIKQAGGEEAKTASWRSEIALIDAGPVLFPDERISESSPRTIAGRKFRVGFENHSVTAGDVWLFDPATRVLASGDLVTLPAPLFDTACAAHWRAALGRLAAVDFTILVPGHGASMTHADFATYRRAFDRLLDCAAGKATKHVCIDGWMHDADALIPSNDKALARSLLDYYMDNNLRGNAALDTKLCADSF